MGSKYHFAQHSPVNKVDFVSKVSAAHVSLDTKRQSQNGNQMQANLASFALTVGRVDSVVVFVNWDTLW